MKHILLASILFSNIALSSSVDNLTVNITTDRKPLNDATTQLNLITNQLIRKAIIDTNIDSYKNKSRHCNYKNLYRNIKENLGGGLSGQLQSFVDTNPSLDKICLDVKQTYYGNYWNSILIFPACVINLNGVNIGSDKFGHFFDQGYELFETTYLLYKGINKALVDSIFQEKTYFGGMVSGIMSYADMVANFQGMRFYASLVGQHRDILRKEIKPLIKCKDGFLTPARKFDWKDYSDHALSEAYNCSKFFTEGQQEQATKHVEFLSGLYNIKDKNTFRCKEHIEDKISKSLESKYGIYKKYLLNFSWSVMNL